MKSITLALAVFTIFFGLTMLVSPYFGIIAPIAPLIAIHLYDKEEDE